MMKMFKFVLRTAFILAGLVFLILVPVLIVRIVVMVFVDVATVPAAIGTVGTAVIIVLVCFGLAWLLGARFFRTRRAYAALARRRRLRAAEGKAHD